MSYLIPDTDTSRFIGAVQGKANDNLKKDEHVVVCIHLNEDLEEKFFTQRFTHLIENEPQYELLEITELEARNLTALGRSFDWRVWHCKELSKRGLLNNAS